MKTLTILTSMLAISATAFLTSCASHDKPVTTSTTTTTHETTVAAPAPASSTRTTTTRASGY